MESEQTNKSQVNINGILSLQNNTKKEHLNKLLNNWSNKKMKMGCQILRKNQDALRREQKHMEKNQTESLDKKT